jgi:hypothetical protein
MSAVFVCVCLGLAGQTWKIEHTGLLSKEEGEKKAAERAARLEAFETGTAVDKASYYVMEGVDFVKEVRGVAVLGGGPVFLRVVSVV